MGYRSRLLFRWSRRDQLAVIAIAVTIAFLTGTVLLLVAVGGQTAAIATELRSPGTVVYESSPASSNSGPGSDSIRLAVATASTADTERTLVVGVPETALNSSTKYSFHAVANATNRTTLGSLSQREVRELNGTAGSVRVTVSPREQSSSIFPPTWYVTNLSVVESLGRDGTFIITPTAETELGNGLGGGAPLVSALRFFLTGTTQTLQAIAAAALGAVLLIGVTVYSVSRMSVRDRQTAIRVIRATGGTPSQVAALFVARALLFTVSGIALGYGLGIIVANGGVNLAVSLGLPTSLIVNVTARVLRVLAPLYTIILGVGGIAGWLAVRPMVRRPPGAIGRENAATAATGSLPLVGQLSISPSVVQWRALVPTAATLTAFVVFGILVAGIVGAVGPLTDTNGATISEPGSTHPVASNVRVEYVDALHDRGINASGEILVFGVQDDQPFLARGARYDDFATVSDASLRRGATPQDRHDAVIGQDLARTLDLAVGDTITLGGSTQAAITRVRLTGVFEAPGPYDDQLIVSLPTARHLANKRADSVMFIRADQLPSASESRSVKPIDVVSVSTDGAVVANRTFSAVITVRNAGLSSSQATLNATYAGQQRRVNVSVPPTSERSLRLSFRAGPPGSARLSVGDRSVPIDVAPPDRLTLTGLPPTIPPDSSPFVRVRNATGSPVAEATVSVKNRTRTTNSNGVVRLPPLSAGNQSVVVRADNRTVRERVRVTPNATRQVQTGLTIEPSNPSLFSKPTARVTMDNSWNRSMVRTVRLTGPGTEHTRTVRIPAGGTGRVRVELPQRPPGQYRVRLALNGTVVEKQTYEVVGDQRVVSALSQAGQTGESGIGQAAKIAFGNLQVLFGLLLALAGLMTVGGTTATFFQAIHARRRTIGIHRATGAPPHRIISLVGRDALLIGTLATFIAVTVAHAILFALSRLGYLTAFGVRLQPTVSPGQLVMIALGGVLLALIGAAIPTSLLLLTSPSELLRETTVQPMKEGPEHE
jgi:ABC-type antimicrobial peptide transport system permease subunit